MYVTTDNTDSVTFSKSTETGTTTKILPILLAFPHIDIHLLVDWFGTVINLKSWRFQNKWRYTEYQVPEVPNGQKQPLRAFWVNSTKH